MIKSFRRIAIAGGLILSLVGIDVHSSTIHKSAFAATGLGCASGATVQPTSGTLSSPGAVKTVQITVNAGALAKNSQVSIGLYDAQYHEGILIPTTSAKTDGNGGYSGTAQLPGGGVAGGSDTLAVSDAVSNCVSTAFTLLPTVTLVNQSGSSFSFTANGFHAGSTITISFVDSAGQTNSFPDLSPLTSDSLGQVSGSNIFIPGAAATGNGTLKFTDAQNSQATTPFNFTGPPPPTATGQPGQPTATNTSIPGQPTATNTSIPGQPTATNTPGFGSTATYTPVPGQPTATNTPGFFPTSTATFTPVPGQPTATNTPSLFRLPTATNTRLPGQPTSTRVPPTATSTPGGTHQFPTSTPTPFKRRFIPPTPGGKPGFPTPTPGTNAAFPTPTPPGGSGSTKTTPHPATCPASRGFTNGGFEQKLNCWSVNSTHAVSTENSVRHKGTLAVRLVASKTQLAMLSQSFSYDPATKSITFYYRNAGALATAQITADGHVLVGRRLPATHGSTFSPVVLTLPAGIHRGSLLTLTFAVQKGTLYLDDVTTSKSPTGGSA